MQHFVNVLAWMLQLWLAAHSVHDRVLLFRSVLVSTLVVVHHGCLAEQFSLVTSDLEEDHQARALAQERPHRAPDVVAGLDY
jgi:hypothetical protein